jgi:hypothetical protein
MSTAVPLLQLMSGNCVGWNRPGATVDAVSYLRDAFLRIVAALEFVMDLRRVGDIHLGRDTLSDVLLAVIPLIGICIGTGVIAILLWLTTGKW